MDIDNGFGKFFQEVRAEYLHVACHDHQIDLICFQLLHLLLLGSGFILLANRNVDKRDAISLSRAP